MPGAGNSARPAPAGVAIIRRVPLLLFLFLAFPLEAAVLRLAAYDDQGRLMSAETLRAHIGRADRRKPNKTGAADILLTSLEGQGFEKPAVEDMEGPVLRWRSPSRVRVSLPWPVKEDGFSMIWLDKSGEGYRDGDTVMLNSEIARAQLEALEKSWRKRTKEWNPIYKPGSKSEKLYVSAREAVEGAAKIELPAKRAAAFDEALRDVSLAWQKLLFEHGLQISLQARNKESSRFGLTLDESFANHVESQDWVLQRLARSGTGWVRLVFRANPSDFAYEYGRSFTVYDKIIAELKSKNIRIMACVLDTTQWRRDLTPELYSRRVRNLVVRYASKIRSWEVGSELNGDWLGGPKTPLGLEKTFRIYKAGVEAVKAHEPTLETVATLYWWEATAPGEEYSLGGWLKRYVPEGFGEGLDVVSLSLQPEDNPVGMAFERVFDQVREALPAQKLMLGSFGYVEKSELNGYWWFDPKDIDAARKDLLVLYTAASCAMPRSLCGGFWWQTLDQMLLPQTKKMTDLFWVHQKSLEQMGR